MEVKPFHYDGSVQNDESVTNDGIENVSFEITEEIRSNISGNPYLIKDK